jgi:ATP-dependent exoDNAse (exonuclease V) beta subunit
VNQHPDAAAGERIRTALDETLFVEAGAGSGKTRALVERVVALVADRGEPMGGVAAITFTEKAAAEMRDRIRSQLAARATPRAGDDDPAAGRCRAALDELDSAAIGTLHSFAQRILSEHPVEAGLPPHIEVLDEVASMVAFDDRWGAFLDRLLDDPDLERPILLLTAAGVRLAALRELALSFNQNWDLVADRGPSAAVDVPPWHEQLEALLSDIDVLCAQRTNCHDENDTLCRVLDRMCEWTAQVRAAPDESARLALLRTDSGRPPAKPNGKGNKVRWVKGYDLPTLRNALAELQERCDDLANEVAHAALVRVAVELRRFTLDAADERRRAGQLEFHDLLVMARQVLRDPAHGPAVRATLAQRYRRLLIDEFQDTDPIQVELAILVASDDPTAGGRPWHAIDPLPGRLFFVGDPKQSIYRFRRADVTLFRAVAARFGDHARGLALTTNHRSGRALVDWINGTFGRLIEPDYADSVPVRPDPPAGPPVAVISRAAHTDRPSADDIRAREAVDVAAAVTRVLAEGWQVDRSSDWQAPDWQPARAGDITILVPTRLSLPFLEDALTTAGIAYRTESASLVYSSRTVRDLFLTLRAIDDPSDELTVVSALRSPLFGCGDDDLFTFRERHGGAFDHSLPLPEDAPPEHPVVRALAYLHEVHERRRWCSTSELVDLVIRERRVLELGDGNGRPRDLWQRMRFVVDQARAWTDATAGSLRQYLDWVRQQSAPGSRVAEAVLPETDDDAVRIMTVHAAKGLQFPVTIVAGLSTVPMSRTAGAQVVWPPDGSCILNVGRKVTSPAFEAWRPIDEQMSHDERIRLLYVACTRARDHLVVSLHRRERSRPAASASRLTNAELLAETLTDGLDDIPDATPAEGDRVALERPPASPVPAVVGFDDWRRQRADALAHSGVPRTIAATALTDEGRPDADDDPGLHKRPGDLDLPPWRKGRYGTAIGRAVHGALQVIDLATGAGLDDAVAAQAAAEGVIGHEAHIGALARAALAAPSIREAAASPHWREVHVAVPVGPGGRTLEGYVDLLYRGPRGLVVVDYKTGPASPDDDLDPLVEGYRLQGASYALAVAEATGEPVVDMVFVFLTPQGPAERPLPDLPTTLTSTRALLTTGSYTTVS